MISVSLQDREDSYQLSELSKEQKLEQVWQMSSLDEWTTPDGGHTLKRRPQNMVIPRTNIEALPKCARTDLEKSKLSWN